MGKIALLELSRANLAIKQVITKGNAGVAEVYPDNKAKIVYFWLW